MGGDIPARSWGEALELQRVVEARRQLRKQSAGEVGMGRSNGLAAPEAVGAATQVMVAMLVALVHGFVQFVHQSTPAVMTAHFSHAVRLRHGKTSVPVCVCGGRSGKGEKGRGGGGSD
jgi:hypothetical protein